MPEFRFSPRPNRAHEIPWLPWGARAFEAAERERKPVLLSISAVWCHWCHVMDETTYSDPGVIDAIREHFVPVRVDNDERPDVNARYNMGGWPTTAFLASDGTALTGATYLPPPQMRRVLGEIATWYAQHEDEIAERARAPHTSARVDLTPADRAKPEQVRRIAETIASAFDEEFGGFGEAPKFPQPELLEFLVVEARATGDDRLRAMAVRTLLAMARGGMYDHVEGGFFRYSTTRDWSIPHFEKMAEENAGLARVLSLELQQTRHDELHATLRSLVGYVTNVLRDPATGFFAGSQDADEEYYALTLDERRALATPYVDRTVYSDRNAALAGALVLAGATLDDVAVADAGVRALDVLHETMLDDEGLLYHVRRPGETPSIRGLLGDQSAYLRALLEAHEASGSARFLERALAVAGAVERRFAADDGGFYDHAGIEAELGRLALRDRPLVENAILAESFMRIAALCGQERYRDVAERTLRVYEQSAQSAGPFAAAYARALRRFLAPPVEVRIVGTEAETAAFREAARRLPSPFVAVRTIEPGDSAALGLASAPTPAAYVCARERCGAPARDAGALRAAYDALLQP